MARIEEGLVGGFNSRDFDEKRIIGEIISIFEIILHVVHYHHAKIAHLAPNEGAWRESGAAWLAPGLSGSKRGRSHVANPGAAWLAQGLSGSK